jgi:two-component system LytT family response regulator
MKLAISRFYPIASKNIARKVSLVASFTKKKKAISHLRNNKPDILFLDIVLDSGSGFDILEEIDHEDIRVVMCSAHDEFALKAISISSHRLFA